MRNIVGKVHREVRFTPEARRDLGQIWTYSNETWSAKQADTYVQTLFRATERIALDPFAYPLRTLIDPPVRLQRVRSHLLIYAVEADHILIIRVMHGRQDWERALSKGED